MKIKTTLAALALSIVPGLAFAGGGCHDGMKEVTASSCKDGAVWDESKGMCVVQPSS
jgi:hypothetical protein